MRVSFPKSPEGDDARMEKLIEVGLEAGAEDFEEVASENEGTVEVEVYPTRCFRV